MDRRLGARTKFSLVYVVVAVIAMALVQEFLVGPLLKGEKEVPYSQFRDDLAAGRIKEVTIEGDQIIYELRGSEGSGGSFNAVRIEDHDLVERLVERASLSKPSGLRTALRRRSSRWSLAGCPEPTKWA